MDRNYKEDQVNEIEALESIYYNDFESKWTIFNRWEKKINQLCWIIFGKHNLNR